MLPLATNIFIALVTVKYCVCKGFQKYYAGMVEIEYAVKMWEESCESNVLHDSNICTNLDYFVNICKYHNMIISSIIRTNSKWDFKFLKEIVYI